MSRPILAVATTTCRALELGQCVKWSFSSLAVCREHHSHRLRDLFHELVRKRSCSSGLLVLLPYRHVRVIEQQQIQREELAMRPAHIKGLFGRVSNVVNIPPCRSVSFSAEEIADLRCIFNRQVGQKSFQILLNAFIFVCNSSKSPAQSPGSGGQRGPTEGGRGGGSTGWEIFPGVSEQRAGPGRVPPTQRCGLEPLQHLTAAVLGGPGWGHTH